jgi:hypothetical protein
MQHFKRPCNKQWCIKIRNLQQACLFLGFAHRCFSWSWKNYLGETRASRCSSLLYSRSRLHHNTREEASAGPSHLVATQISCDMYLNVPFLSTKSRHYLKISTQSCQIQRNYFFLANWKALLSTKDCLK